MKRHWLLLGALLVGLVARIPGIFWGSNYPTGWMGHHIDEYTHLGIAGCLINPALPDGCTNGYPRGMAAHVALPLIALRAVKGQIADGLPPPATIITIGRVVAVIYGVATILVVFLLARLLFPAKNSIAYLAAWILALGGLHVTQSHFFLSDTAAILWTFLGLYLIGRFVACNDDTVAAHLLNAAGFCLGVGFGMKLAVQALPSLAIAVLLFHPQISRLRRLLYVAIFFAAGFCIVNLDAYSPAQLFQTLRTGSAVGLRGYHFSRWAGTGIYLLELPSLLSLPVTLLCACGVVLLARRMFENRLVILTVTVPTAVGLWFVLFKSDNFPRHLLIFFPVLAIAAAWSLERLAEFLHARGVPRAIVIAPVFLYLALFVFDGERVFRREPRNQAAQWLMDNVPKGTRVSWIAYLGTGRSAFSAVPGYQFVEYPNDPQPDVILCEMVYANWFLSGMGWRNSYPRDNKIVFPWFTEKSLPAWQALFEGKLPYQQAAQFTEGYFMPEYVWTDRLIGNRARNYLGEVVIFRRAISSSAQSSIK